MRRGKHQACCEQPEQTKCEHLVIDWLDDVLTLMCWYMLLVVVKSLLQM